MREILDAQLPPRQGRVIPRVVKKPRSQFPAKKPHHLNQGTQQPQLLFAISDSA
jgi:hypothetical protein